MCAVAAFFFGLTTLLAGLMPTLVLAVLAMLGVGIFSIYFTSLGNSILQLHSEPQMRGRVMAFWAIAFLGSTTIGGPVIGWVGQTFGPRAGLGLGGAAAILAAVYGVFTLRHLPPREKKPAGIVAQAESAAEQDVRIQ